jgi:hypothetical protein
MKLLVIGHSVEDHILFDGKETIKPGGIYYVVSALTSFLKDDQIFLCSYAENRNYSMFADVYDRCAADFIQFIEAIPKVSLSIHGAKERDEHYNNIIPKLNIPYERLNEFDGIIISMVTGFDIELNQLQEIRKNFQGLIYFDVHTLSRGLGHHGHRGFRKIENFNKWAECVDIIQANEHEVKTLTLSNDEVEIAHEIFNNRTKQLIVTRGEAGAKLYYWQNREFNFIFQSSLKTESVNKIGLGDVFGAAYFYNYVKTGDLFRSLNIAVTASGIASGPDGLSKLKSI